MALGKNNNEDGPWMSLSDMMTGLMVIFLFVAISYMVKTNEQKEDLEEFKATEDKLYSELKEKFKDDTIKWEMKVDNDLSIKFTNPDVLFASGEATLTPKFEKILDSFLPKYFDVLLPEEYNKKISEIRIEGHTDSSPLRKNNKFYDKDPYIGNMVLSQERAVAILKYYRKKYAKESKDIIKKFLITTNGFSYGKTLDDDRKSIRESGKKENKKLSRRVEFRIITNSRKLLKEYLEKGKKEQIKK